MKIMVPFSSQQNIESLDIFRKYIEIYAGFFDEKWETVFLDKNLNRMSSHGNAADLNGIDEFIDLVKKSHDFEIKIYLTLNHNEYSDSEINYIAANYLPKLKEAGVDGIIIGCEKLIKPIHDHGINIIASTMLGIYNQGLVEYYKEKNIKRQIIPRDVSLYEIKQLTEQNTDVDFEVFLMRNGCKYSDSNCFCQHGKNGGICRRIDNSSHYYLSDKFENFDTEDWALTDHLYTKYFHLESCALCSIWRLIQAGVKSGKIVGRADDPQRVLRDLEICVKNLRIAEASKSEEEYLRKMCLPEESVKYCRYGYSCYYPEVRYGGYYE